MDLKGPVSSESKPVEYDPIGGHGGHLVSKDLVGYPTEHCPAEGCTV